MAGRPRKLTDKLKAHILSLIADGLTIRELFSRDDVPITWQSFRAYLIKDNEFGYLIFITAMMPIFHKINVYGTNAQIKTRFAF